MLFARGHDNRSSNSQQNDVEIIAREAANRALATSGSPIGLVLRVARLNGRYYKIPFVL